YRTPDTFFADLDKGNKAIADVTGVTPKIFRFPGGSNNLVSKNVQDPALYSNTEWIMPDLIKRAHARGERYFDWNVSNGDASSNSYTVQSAVANVQEGVKGLEQVVILSHDSAPKHNTVKSLQIVIDHLKNEGYSFSVL